LYKDNVYSEENRSFAILNDIFVIEVLDKSFEIFIDKDEIAQKVSFVADRINKDYHGKEVIFIAVLNGAFMFASDLLKNIHLSCEISFVKMSSYQGTQTTGVVDELLGLNTDVEGKDVIIIEDIVDTGHTIEKIISLLNVKSRIQLKSVHFYTNQLHSKELQSLLMLDLIFQTRLLLDMDWTTMRKEGI